MIVTMVDGLILLLQTTWGQGKGLPIYPMWLLDFEMLVSCEARIMGENEAILVS
jgi:hypothetical protein